MHRRKERKRGSRKAFLGRNSKTHRLNVMQPLRGGIRL